MVVHGVQSLKNDLITWLAASCKLAFVGVLQSITEGGPGKQVTTTGVGPGNISKWKLNFFQKFEFKERGYFGTIKKKTPK